MKQPINYRHVYGQSVLKSSEGGPGTATLVAVFKSRPIKGVKVEFFSSCYVGQTAFRVYATTKVKLKQAAAVLKNYGYVDSIKYVNRHADSF